MGRPELVALSSAGIPQILLEYLRDSGREALDWGQLRVPPAGNATKSTSIPARRAAAIRSSVSADRGSAFTSLHDLGEPPGHNAGPVLGTRGVHELQRCRCQADTQNHRDRDKTDDLASDRFRQNPGWNAHLGRLYRRGENIAAQAYGLDQDRVARIGLDLLPDAADMDIDAALDWSGLLRCESIPGVVPATGCVLGSAEGAQQIEFRAGHHHLHPVYGSCWTGDGVDFPPIEPEWPRAAVAGAPTLCVPAKQPANARDKLPGIEGLGYAVIRPDLDAEESGRYLR